MHFTKSIPPRRSGATPEGLEQDSPASASGNFLDQEIAKVNALIAKIREGIDRLKEYRTALISAAVTGKIDIWEGGPR